MFSFPSLLKPPHHSHITPTKPPPHPRPLAPYPHLLVLILLPSFHSPLTLLNTEPHRSMDLPWIFPDLLFLPWTPISGSFPKFLFPCFTFISALLLPCHHVFPHLASILDPLYHHRLPFHTDSLSPCHHSSFLLIKLHYDSFPMTHSYFPSYINP